MFPKTFVIVRLVVILVIVGSFMPLTQAQAQAPQSAMHDEIFGNLHLRIAEARYYSYNSPIKNHVISVKRLLTLRGRNGEWNGYAPYPNHPTWKSFDHFAYPRNGAWYGYIELTTPAGPKYMFFWKESNDNQEVLTFLYRDLEVSEGPGGRKGNCHYAWWGAVSLTDLLRILK